MKRMIIIIMMIITIMKLWKMKLCIRNYVYITDWLMLFFFIFFDRAVQVFISKNCISILYEVMHLSLLAKRGIRKVQETNN